MQSVNAMVLPDGTILCSLKLLEEAESEEAVKGVLGHELQHVASEDTKHIKEAMDKPKPDFGTILRHSADVLGLKRFAEHRADIEGAIVKLDRAGINPFGYKLFLEKLSHQERSKKYQSDAVHGRSVDRALSWGLFTRYYNLPSLTHELHEIPEKEVATWRSNLPPAQTVTTFFRTTDLRDANARQTILREELAAIKQMPFARLNSVAQELFDHWMQTSMAPTTAKRVESLLKTAAATIDETLKQQYPEGNNRWLARLAHFALFTGVDIALTNSELENEPYEETVKSLRKPAQLLKTSQDFERFRQLIDTMSTNELPYAAGDPNTLMRVVARIGSQQAELFASHDVWFEEMMKLTTSLMQFSEKKSVFQVTEYELMATAIAVVKKQLQRTETPEAADTFAITMQAKLADRNIVPPEVPFKPTVASPDEIFVSTFGVSRDTPEKQLARTTAANSVTQGMLRIFGTTRLPDMPKGKWQQAEPKILALLKQELSNFNLFETLYVVRSWMEILNTIHLGQYSLGEKPNSGMQNSLKELLMEHSSIKILPAIIQTILLQELTATNINRQDKAFSFKEEKAFEQAAQQVCALSETDFLQFVDLYEFYTEPIDSVRRSVNITTSSFLSQALVRNPTSKSSELPTIYLVQELAQLKPTVIFDRIHHYEQAGIKVKELLYLSAENYCAPVVECVTKNIDELLQSDYADEVIDFLENTLDDMLLIEQFKKFVQRKRYHEAVTVDEKFDLCFKDPKTRLDIDLKDQFIETVMRSRTDFEKVQTAFRTQISEISSQGSAQLGVMSLLDSTSLLTEEPEKALQKLLRTRKDDRAIKDDIAVEVEHHAVTFLQKDSKWAQETGRRKLQGLVVSLDRLLQSLYVMPQTARFALVKRLLVDSGMIHDTKQRQSVLKMLFSEVVTPPRSANDQELHGALGQITEAIGKIDDWELMFYLIAPVLAEHIARPPAKPVPWDDVYEFENKYEHLEDFNLKNTLKPEALRKADEYPWRKNLGYSAIAAEHLRGFLAKQDLLEPDKPVKQLSPVEFIVDAAPRTGALIVRILQMLPQFMDIKTEQAEVFNQLYDKMRGQSKLAAIATVERDWPQMWDSIAEFGERIGGGSLMTVYRIATKDAEPKVIRVVNPNIAFHLEASRKFVLNTIEELRKNNAIDESLYKQLHLAVDTVSVWIKEELNFENFLERDQEFHKHNDTFTYEDCQYSMLVPKSEGPASNAFQIEQEVKGRNLTDWDTLEAEGHDMKQIVALIVKSYRQQIGTGLAHGDVHIGNYAVTPNHEIAIFDRTYFIKLSEPEQRIMQSALDGQVDFSAVAEYLQTLLPADGSVDLATVIPQVTALGEAVMAKDFVTVNRSIMTLRQEGVNVPLHISLLLRNVQALTKLAEKAKFANLQEALDYTH